MRYQNGASFGLRPFFSTAALFILFELFVLFKIKRAAATFTPVSP